MSMRNLKKMVLFLLKTFTMLFPKDLADGTPLEIFVPGDTHGAIVLEILFEAQSFGDTTALDMGKDITKSATISL